MKTAVCIASGPSLTKDDVEFCRGKARIYAVKECANLAPWADVLYAADTDWWERFNGFPDFAGERWTVSDDAARKYGLNLIKYRSDIAWSDTPGLIASGGNSGFQALNMAVLDGAERVILLGYDMGYAPGQDKHWWEKEHPRESRTSNYQKWLQNIDKAAPLIAAKAEVLNASRQTAITAFPIVNLRDVL